MQESTETWHARIEALVQMQRRIQVQSCLKDQSVVPLFTTAWECVWKGLRELACSGENLEKVLFTIEGGFNICADFLRSGCHRMALQALNMTLAYAMPDEMQHRMENAMAASEVKIPDMGFGAGKIQVKKEKS